MTTHNLSRSLAIKAIKAVQQTINDTGNNDNERLFSYREIVGIIESYEIERVKAYKEYRAYVRAKLPTLPDEYHGKASTYKRYNCKCDKCVLAKRQEEAAYKVKIRQDNKYG